MHTVHSNAEDILPVYCQAIGFLSKIGFSQLITTVNVHNPWKNGNAITSITSHVCAHECTYTVHDQTSLTVLVFIGGVAECLTIIQMHLKVSQACKDETGQCQLLSCGEANSQVYSALQHKLSQPSNPCKKCYENLHIC